MNERLCLAVPWTVVRAEGPETNLPQRSMTHQENGQAQRKVIGLRHEDGVHAPCAKDIGLSHVQQ